MRVVIAKQPGADDMVVKNEANTVPKQEISVEKDIVDSVPKTMKKKAQRLLEKMTSMSGVEWNDRGELVYKNTAVTGRNMVDLVNDVLRKRKAFEPQGWQTFARVLKEWYTASSIISYIDFDRSKFFMQDWHVLYIIEAL